jgi:hypothetical protein
MRKSTKILLGLGTLWPFIYLILFFIFVFSTVFFLAGGNQQGDPPVIFFAVFALHFLTILWVMALTVFYMVNVFKNDRVDKDKKVLWAVVLFMGNMIAMPIYWYLYFWKEPAISTSTPPTLNSGAPSL